MLSLTPSHPCRCAALKSIQDSFPQYDGSMSTSLPVLAGCVDCLLYRSSQRLYGTPPVSRPCQRERHRRWNRCHQHQTIVRIACTALSLLVLGSAPRTCPASVPSLSCLMQSWRHCMTTHGAELMMRHSLDLRDPLTWTGIWIRTGQGQG